MKKKFNKANIILGFFTSLIAIITFIMMFIPKSSNDLAGEWLMTSIIDEADKESYIGLEIQWKMFITEFDDKINGTAEKIKINGVDLNYNQRTSMNFDGAIKNNILIINYTEDGKKRKTNGIIKATFQEDKFLGTFSQTASNAKGSISGLKIN